MFHVENLKNLHQAHFFQVCSFLKWLYANQRWLLEMMSMRNMQMQGPFFRSNTCEPFEPPCQICFFERIQPLDSLEHHME